MNSRSLSAIRIALIVAVAALPGIRADAQETIYLLQEVPSEIWGFTFDGTGLTSLDVDPDPTRQTLAYSPASRQLSATDNWFVLGNGQPSSSTNITDPNGISLPPSSTSVAGNGSLILSADERFAFTIEQNGLSPARMAVVDVDPASSTFLQELATLDLQVGGAGITRNGALSADGATLYVAIGGFGGGSASQIQAVDVTDPANLGPSDILSTTAVPMPASFNITWDPPVTSLRRFSLGGNDYLLMSRQAVLQVLEISAPDTLVLRMSLSSPQPATGTSRFFRDAVAFDDAGTPRAIAVADTCDWDGVSSCLTTGEEELLAIDLTLPLPLEDDGGAGTTISNSHRLVSPDGEASMTADYSVEWGNLLELRQSLDGQTVYLLSDNPSPGSPARGRLRAFDVADVVGGPANSASPVGGSVYTDVYAFDMLVRDQVAPPAGAPMITDAVLDASEGGGVTLQNDAPRAIDITGSNLANVTHVFLGTSFGSLDAVGSTTIDATMPALVPTGNHALAVVSDTGGIGTFDGLVVVPPADFLPNAVAYVGNDDGSFSIVSASTSSEVAPSVASILGINAMAVSPDGRYLMVAGFASNQIGVHCIVYDQNTSSVLDPGNPLGYAGYVWSGCSAWNDLVYSHRTSGEVGGLGATKPDGSRAYVNTLWPTVDIFDMTASPPVAVGKIDVSAPTWGADPTYIPRGIAATSTHLYLGNDGLNRQCGGSCGPGTTLGPYVIAIDIADDVVDPLTEIHPIDIPALSGSFIFGRGDGLAVHPDESRLYYAMAGSPTIWVLDIGTDPIAPTVAAGPAVPGFAVGEVFNLSVSPTGNFLYVARRSGNTHIYDLSDKDNPALVATVYTGPFSNALKTSPTGDYVYVPVSTRNAAVVIDERPGSPTQHQILTVVGTNNGPGVVTVTPGIQTETGSNVAVEPIEGSEITFDDVTTSGSTTVTAANVSSTPLPADFEIAGIGVFYDVNTTASFAGNVNLCFTYDESLIPMGLNESDLKLLHEEKYDGSKCDPPGSVPCWDDVTAAGSPDTVANQICGTVSSFSQFVAAVQALVRPRIDIKPGDPDNEINLTSNGVVNVAIFGSGAFDVTTIDPNSLALAGGPIRQKKQGAAVTYTDLDGDGFLDLKAQFQIAALQLTEGAASAEVTADLDDGKSMLGSDLVNVVQ